MFRPRANIFLLCLLFHLDIKALIIASTANLEAGLRFAGMESTVTTFKNLILQNETAGKY